MFTHIKSLPTIFSGVYRGHDMEYYEDSYISLSDYTKIGEEEFRVMDEQLVSSGLWAMGH